MRLALALLTPLLALAGRRLSLDPCAPLVYILARGEPEESRAVASLSPCQLARLQPPINIRSMPDMARKLVELDRVCSQSDVVVYTIFALSEHQLPDCHKRPIP